MNIIMREQNHELLTCDRNPWWCNIFHVRKKIDYLNDLEYETNGYNISELNDSDIYIKYFNLSMTKV